jgi:alkanesulfonate monooxygenase SsuD/methylene tetrahydromethanopterin reductase-like flavin-dependent oxidoreductase (luciferase family)
LKQRFGLSLPWSPLDKLIIQAEEAEKVGFDSLWYPDHLITPGPDVVLESFSTLAVLAVKTRRCMMGPMVVDPIRRHPSSLAHATLTLDNISNGRAFLGIGAGEPMNLSPFGLKLENPVRTLSEAIQLIRGLWSATKENPFSFDGKIFKTDKACLGLESIQKPTPTIYVGALGPKTRQVTGELADGWIPYVHSLSNYGKLVQEVKNGAKKAGRDPKEIDIVANIPVLLLERDDDQKRKDVRRRLAIRLLLETNTLRDLGWKDEIPPEICQSNMIVSPSISKRLEEEADKIPMEIAEQIAAIGTPSQVIETLKSYRKLGATHFLIRLMGKDAKKNLQEFGTKVISAMS